MRIKLCKSHTGHRNIPFVALLLALALVFTACTAPSEGGDQDSAETASTATAIATSTAATVQGDGENDVATSGGVVTSPAVSSEKSATDSVVSKSSNTGDGAGKTSSDKSKDKSTSEKDNKKNSGDSNDKKKDSTESSKPDNTNGGNTGDHSKDQPTPAPKPAPANSKLTVFISIDCLTLYDADPGTASQVSSKGIMLAKKEVTVDSGANVYDVLKASGISFVGKSYISSIAGLSEGDGGGKSGWVYNVNGKYPEVGVAAYKVKAGDAVQFRYTMNGGNDVKG